MRDGHYFGSLEVILHNVRSNHNVGSIFRTADAAGFSKVYLCGITPAPTDKFQRPNRELAKVALGAQNFLQWEKVRSTVGLIKKLKREGRTILALEQSKQSIPYSKFGIRHSRFALVLGDEVRGLPRSVLNLADRILEIPMRGKKESLNVAVAFGVAAFSFINSARK